MHNYAVSTPFCRISWKVYLLYHLHQGHCWKQILLYFRGWAKGIWSEIHAQNMQLLFSFRIIALWSHSPLNAVQEHKPWITVWAKTQVGCEWINRFPTQMRTCRFLQYMILPAADSEYFLSFAHFCTFTPMLRRVNPSCSSKEKASPITRH